MSDSERSQTPADEVDQVDNGDKNGPRNGDGDDYEDRSPKVSKERGRRGSASGSGNEAQRSRSRSRSESKSRHSKKRKSHRRSRSRSRDRRSRSRSRRRSTRTHKKRSRSRSRSRSLSRGYDKRRRNSRSPSYGKPRFFGAREAPAQSRCLGVFGMSMYTDEKQLERYFSQFGKIEAIQIVYDRKTRRSRGFAFVYFERLDDAITAKERAVGTEIDGQRVRIDFSITSGPHAPTPGMYMGRRRDGPEEHGRFGGSPSYRRRSRSRSYSPRR